MNTKRMLLSLGFTLVFLAALPLRAQSGCVDSPEDPTIFLALFGGAGALIAGLRATRQRKH